MLPAFALIPHAPPVATFKDELGLFGAVVLELPPLVEFPPVVAFAPFALVPLPA